MSQSRSPRRLLFVCHGNICRSPAAEGAFLHLLKERGLAGEFIIDSAGTSGYHAGEQPHPDTRRAARARGIELQHRSRIVTTEDFQTFDLLLAMDHENYENLLHMAPEQSLTEKVVLFRRFDPLVKGETVPGVPDPYYGGFAGFENVQRIVERTAAGLLDHLNQKV